LIVLVSFEPSLKNRPVPVLFKRFKCRRNEANLALLLDDLEPVRLGGLVLVVALAVGRLSVQQSGFGQRPGGHLTLRLLLREIGLGMVGHLLLLGEDGGGLRGAEDEGGGGGGLALLQVFFHILDIVLYLGLYKVRVLKQV